MKTSCAILSVCIILLCVPLIQAFSMFSLTTKFGCTNDFFAILFSPWIPICRCGQRPGSTLDTEANRIIGGKSVKIEDFPWNAQVAFPDRDHGFCGGSLISDRFVVTAAHCVEFVTSPGEIKVRLGATTRSGDTAEEFAVSEIFVHESYVSVIAGYDIAVIKLVESVIFDDRKQPICLPCQKMSYDGTELGDITGWGFTTLSGNQPTELQFAQNLVMNYTECSASGAVSSVLPLNTICGTTGVSDACLGDSGGPYSLEVDSVFYLMGVTSFGISCNIFPGVYTDVSAYIDWIENITEPIDYCAPF